VTIDS